MTILSPEVKTSEPAGNTDFKAAARHRKQEVEKEKYGEKRSKQTKERRKT
jgi:hypothetical protein